MYKATTKEVKQAVLIGDCFGTEFSPITDDTPYVLLPLVNIPLLDYTLDFLSLGGIEVTYVLTCKGANEIQQYIKERSAQNASWCRSMSVQVISSETSRSYGDCLRDLDSRGCIRSNFVLVDPGAIGNYNLQHYLDLHSNITKKDRGAAITLLFQDSGIKCRGSCAKDEITFAANSNNRILFYWTASYNSKLELPLDIVTGNSQVDIYHNLKDMHVAICSPSVLPLFSDNFDFQTRDDFIRGLIMNEEILNSTIYFQNVKPEEYGGAVTNWRMYQSISYDIIARWVYPLTPETLLAAYGIDVQYHKSNVYKPNDVRTASGVNLKENVVLGSNTFIGADSYISQSVIGNRVKIGQNVSIENSFIFSGTTIEDDVEIKDSVIGHFCLIKSRSVISKGCILGSNVVLPKCSEVQDVLINRQSDDSNINYEKLGKSAFVIKSTCDSTDTNNPRNKTPNRLILGDTDSESISAEEESASENSSFRNSPAPDDTNLFLNEVMDSLARGFEEQISCSNLILEINSSRYAYNMSLEEVNVNLVKAVLELPFQNLPYHQCTGVQYFISLKPMLKYYSPLFKNYIRDRKARCDALEAIKDTGSSNSEITDSVVRILEWFYDNNFLEEEDILEWFDSLDPNSKIYQKVKPFISWLQEAEECSSSSDDE